MTPSFLKNIGLAAIPLEEIPREDLNPENTVSIPYGVEFSGNMAYLTIASFAALPYSHITVGIPMLSYYMEVGPIQRTDRGVMPDYPVKPAEEDLLNGTDRVSQFAKLLARELQASGSE
jgi:hypothetical protein